MEVYYHPCGWSSGRSKTNALIGRSSSGALLVGATRQSVNQELRRWEKAGWIRIGYGGVEVIDRAALEREMAGN